MPVLKPALIRSALRRLWFYSPERRTALKRQKVAGRSLWICEACRTITPKPEVDHRVAVGRTPGTRGADLATWDALIARLFCEPAGLAILCRTCHAERTAAQRRGAEGKGHTDLICKIER